MGRNPKILIIVCADGGTPSPPSAKKPKGAGFPAPPS